MHRRTSARMPTPITLFNRFRIEDPIVPDGSVADEVEPSPSLSPASTSTVLDFPDI